ncbi:MAG: GNAT family N-acetyltransferase [Chloroflexota bacterium]
MSDFAARFAAQTDLDFVSRDGYISREAVARKIDSKEVVVAEAGGQPVGYLRLEYLWSLVAYIALIWVRPERRRQGVGQIMLAFVGQHLSQNGHDALYSSSQADEPEPQAWHRRMGFEECGFIDGLNKGGVGEIFFRLRLAAQSPPVSHKLATKRNPGG